MTRLPGPPSRAALHPGDAGLFRDCRRGGWVPIHRDVVRLARDALEPGAQRRKSGKIEIALVRHVGVRIERDVGDGVAVGGEEAASREMLFHHRERLIALLHPVLERMLLHLASALYQGEPEPGLAEVGLERMLLEVHPLQWLGPVGAVLRGWRGGSGD